MTEQRDWVNLAAIERLTIYMDGHARQPFQVRAWSSNQITYYVLSRHHTVEQADRARARLIMALRDGYRVYEEAPNTPTP